MMQLNYVVTKHARVSACATVLAWILNKTDI